MTSTHHLSVSATAAEALAVLYWQFPFTRTAYAKGSTDQLVELPLPPRPAPRRQIESASEALGHRIPDWVVALWCCRVHLGVLSDREAAELGDYLCGVDAAAHAGGAPASILFFAGDGSLYPGVDTYSARRHEFVKGSMRGWIYGFDPSGDPKRPEILEYLQSAKDPQRRLVRTDLGAFLRQRARSSREADDADVFSTQSYASIQATRNAERPAFVLRWEDQTPPMAAPPTAEPARVTHSKFGVGTVTAREGSGDSAKVTVEFADGTRTILARFVRPARD